ncbi:LolA family protein [Chryseosolibacter indicus]|uniref:Outer membrane lipoprotein carrier protein LolA n=1 Tax=Chryseosolibacter indicus TaxID=2782351 RepID=A0ABS5VXY6_9BACT|nr:outer membrane lipoprotein carrier protein LolA [Chryseosolibacter indicus]MBT1706273.1 outer membrane lipoprotein carrier protein LolA [Chryseosolibacter indicus]
MKKSILAVILLTFVKVTFAQYDPKALEILDAMSKKYKSIPAFEANISYTLTNETEKINEEFKGKITVKGDKYKLVLPEQEVINNGATLWTYLPEAKEVNIDNYDPNSDDLNPSKFYEIYKKGFKYLFLEEKTEGGVLCEVVDLVPEKKDAQYFKVRMNIAKKDKSIQSWTMFDKGGNKYKYSITKFTPSPSVSDGMFTFDPKKYPGVEVIDLR